MSEPHHQHQTNPDAMWRFHQFAPNATEKSGRAFSGATGNGAESECLAGRRAAASGILGSLMQRKINETGEHEAPQSLPYSHHRVAMLLVESGWTLIPWAECH
jgi:hypothetical protein